MNFALDLIQWYNENKRDLPWRNTKDAYAIWLSEVILQQTRVAQGMPYYMRFVETYPTIADFAAAEEKDILRIWQGLGYYTRARNMHHTAQIIVNEHNGQFPDNYKALKKLKGIGDYTAAAIASFAFEEKVATVDGNVFRVLARVFGVEEDIASTKGKKVFAELAKTLLPDNQVSTYNQAVMEFGALYCKPSSPDCPNCIFQGFCVAFAQKKQDILPIKAKKVTVKKRYLYYFVIECNGKLLLKERGEGDVWQGLYDFVLVEKDKLSSKEKIAEKTEITEEEIAENEPIKSISLQINEKVKELSTLINDHEQEFMIDGIDKSLVFVGESPTYLHQLTHQTLYVTFSHIRINDDTFANTLAEESQGNFYDLVAIHELPKPILIDNYLKGFKLSKKV